MSAQSFHVAPELELERVRTIHERFAEVLSQRLGLTLRARVHASVVGVQRQPWGTFLAALSSPACFIPLEIGESCPCGLLGVSPGVACSAVDLLLGGSGTVGPRPPRELTPFECQLLSGHVPGLARELELQWKRWTNTSIRALGLETRTEFLKGFTHQSPVVTTSMELTINSTQGELSLALPVEFTALLTAAGGPGLSRGTPPNDQCVRMSDLLTEALVDCEVLLEGSKIRLADLRRLGPGALLMLDHPVDCPVQLVLNGSVRIEGEVRAQGARMAFQVGR
jgi:flagellar motor switch protein FliM